MTSIPITTHVEDALDRLREHYRRASGIRAMVAANAGQTQSLEDALNKIKSTRSIADATGIHLDRIGEIIGAPRPGNVPDSVYRVILWGKGAANVSAGRPEDVIRAYKALTQATNVRFEEVYPAKVSLFSNGVVDSATAPYVEMYLKKALALGVGLEDFGTFDGDDEPGFGFFENPDALGFGDLDDPDVGGGLGALAG